MVYTKECISNNLINGYDIWNTLKLYNKHFLDNLKSYCVWYHSYLGQICIEQYSMIMRQKTNDVCMMRFEILSRLVQGQFLFSEYVIITPLWKDISHRPSFPVYIFFWLKTCLRVTWMLHFQLQLSMAWCIFIKDVLHWDWFHNKQSKCFSPTWKKMVSQDFINSFSILSKMVFRKELQC